MNQYDNEYEAKLSSIAEHLMAKQENENFYRKLEHFLTIISHTGTHDIDEPSRTIGRGLSEFQPGRLMGMSNPMADTSYCQDLHDLLYTQPSLVAIASPHALADCPLKTLLLTYSSPNGLFATLNGMAEHLEKSGKMRSDPSHKSSEPYLFAQLCLSLENDSYLTIKAHIQSCIATLSPYKVPLLQYNLNPLQTESPFLVGLRRLIRLNFITGDNLAALKAPAADDSDKGFSALGRFIRGNIVTAKGLANKNCLFVHVKKPESALYGELKQHQAQSENSLYPELSEPNVKQVYQAQTGFFAQQVPDRLPPSYLEATAAAMPTPSAPPLDEESIKPAPQAQPGFFATQQPDAFPPSYKEATKLTTPTAPLLEN